MQQPNHQSSSIGDLVRRIFKKYFGSFDSFFKLTLVFELPYSLLLVWYSQQLQSIKSISETLSQAQSLHLIQTSLTMLGISFLYFFILAPLFIGAISHFLYQSDETPNRQWPQSVRHAFKRFVPLLATSLLAGVFIVVAAVLVSVLLVLLQIALGPSTLSGNMVRLLVVMLMGCVSVFFFIRFCMLYNVTSFEDKMGWTAMTASWRMTRGLFWRLLMILVLIWLVNAAFTIFIPTLLKPIFPFGPVFDNTVLVMVSLLTAPLTPIALSIAYFDSKNMHTLQ